MSFNKYQLSNHYLPGAGDILMNDRHAHWCFDGAYHLGKETVKHESPQAIDYGCDKCLSREQGSTVKYNAIVFKVDLILGYKNRN